MHCIKPFVIARDYFNYSKLSTMDDFSLEALNVYASIQDMSGVGWFVSSQVAWAERRRKKKDNKTENI